MRRLAVLAVASLAFALYAQEQVTTEQQETAQLEEQVAVEETVEQQEADVSQQLADLEQKLQAQQETFQQQLAEMEQKLADATAPVVIEEEKEEIIISEPVIEKKYPNIKQNGNINLISRMELHRAKDFEGEKREDLMNGNVRRLMLGWNYRFLVEINEKLDMGFRLSDPEGGQGETIAGSGKSGETNKLSLLLPALPNVWFTWKPAANFNLSGGLVNVAGNTTLDLAAVAVTKDATRTFGDTYYNSLAGFDFAFPFASSKVFVTAGISDNSYYRQDPEVGTDSYSDAKIIAGANLSFAENRIILKPAVQILTRGDVAHGFFDSDNKPLITEGIDAGFRISEVYSLNLGICAAHDKHKENGNFTLVNFSAEPVFNFGGENNKLFNLRAKYGFFVRNDADNDNIESALVQHIDTRLGIAINEKFSIVPRYRLWTGNAANTENSEWFVIPSGDNDKSAKTLHRFELGFAASF